MSLQVEKLEHNMAKLTIEVSAEDVIKPREMKSFRDDQMNLFG